MVRPHTNNFIKIIENTGHNFLTPPLGAAHIVTRLPADL